MNPNPPGRPGPPSPGGGGLQPWQRIFLKALGGVALAVLTAVVGSWATHKFDEADTNNPPVNSPASGATPEDSPDGAVIAAPPTPQGAGLHCRESLQTVGTVQWWPCARVEKGRITFGAVLRNGRQRQALRLSVGYFIAVPKQFTSCTGEAGSQFIVDANTDSRWITVAGCEVAREPVAVQAEVRAGTENGKLSAPFLSPTLHVQQNGSVIDTSRPSR